MFFLSKMSLSSLCQPSFCFIHWNSKSVLESVICRLEHETFTSNKHYYRKTSAVRLCDVESRPFDIMHRGKLKAAWRPLSCSQLEIFFAQSDPSAYMDSSGSHQHGEAASQIHAPPFLSHPDTSTACKPPASHRFTWRLQICGVGQELGTVYKWNSL